jgi:probable rRNA maturation factor
MRKLNRAYRGIDKTTDVLSFPQTDTTTFRKSTLVGDQYLLGDIVVNLHKAERQAREYNSTFHEELKKLLIHGLLHLIGFDHEIDAHSGREMDKKSRELFKKVLL